MHHSHLNIKKTIKTIMHNNVELTDEFERAQLFNIFFTGLASELEGGILITNTGPLKLVSRVYASLFIYPLSVEECTSLLTNSKILRQVFINYP